MKNKVAATFVFTLIVIVGLMALHELPTVEIGGRPLRKVDLLSDLRPEPVEVVADTDTVVLPQPVKPAFVDSCKAGITCIEDYADSAEVAMAAFYEALEARHAMGRPVRIAYFGDSFIEGDILTAGLRTLLQDRFGGCGVGYVNMASETAGFRTTVHHTFSDWESHASTDHTGFSSSKQDLSNRYFVPHPGSWMTLEGTSHVAHLDSCQTSAFFFYSPDSVRLTAQVNGGDPVLYELPGDSTVAVRSVSVSGNIHKIRWTVEEAPASARCFAATMDGASGVTVDNFSLRGCSGLQLAGVPMSVLREYNRLRPYDLIVLQYGLNIASNKVKDYSYYTRPMEKVIDHLRAAFPKASVLIVGVGDRDEKTETGELQTIPCVRTLIRYQQDLAARTHVAFWNLFEAMGGEGSMAAMAHQKPAQANLDYTHINFRGGKHLAGLLFESLMYGKEQYEKRKAYESK